MSSNTPSYPAAASPPTPAAAAWLPADVTAMRRALELAARGVGHVEPNPPVGAVLVAPDGTIVAEGWHARFGGPHAEAAALAAAGAAARGTTLFVTLEPCCHHGKTPPCTAAIITAGVDRVVVAADDPFPAVAGGGIAALRAAGVTVEVGLLAAEARRLTAPFRMLVEQGRPWVIAKWAASLDGRLAVCGPPTDAAGSVVSVPEADRWISSAESRVIVHALRSRVDAIAVGIGTVLADDPLLTVRLPPMDPSDGPQPPRDPTASRQPLRIVLDAQARLPLSSRLVRTARETPVIVATGPQPPRDRVAALEAAGCEVLIMQEPDPVDRLTAVCHDLGRRRCTNLLVEGGRGVFRSLFAAGLADELWAFIAGRVIGAGMPAVSDRGPPPEMPEPPAFDVESVAYPGGDLFVRGMTRRVLSGLPPACRERPPASR